MRSPSQYRHELLIRYRMKHLKLAICEHCGRNLEPDSRILGIEHCPTCDGPFSRRVLMRWLMAALWGALLPLGLGFFFYFFMPMENGETILLGICLVVWLLMTLIVALQKILPRSSYGGGNGAGGWGGGNGGGGNGGG